jgi:hypothetical protein
VLLAFLGYAKAPTAEPFDPEKFMITPLTGVLAGIVIALYGLDYVNASAWLANAGAIELIEIVGKSLVRRF